MYHIQSGFKHIIEWVIFTVFVAGIPLIIFMIFSWIFGIDQWKETTQLSSFFFSSTITELFFRVEDREAYKISSMSGFKSFLYIMIFWTLVLYVMVSYIDFRGYKMAENSMYRIKELVVVSGGTSLILSAISRFIGGYYE